MDEVCRDHSPIIITRNRGQSVVMLSLKDYEQLEETACLLRSPANARRLLSAIGGLEKSRGRQRKIDLEPGSSFSRNRRGRIIFTGSRPTNKSRGASTN